MSIQNTAWQAIRKRQGKITKGDLASDTGLSLYESEQMLEVLLKERPARIQVASDGTLIYLFDISSKYNPFLFNISEATRKIFHGITNFFRGIILFFDNNLPLWMILGAFIIFGYVFGVYSYETIAVDFSGAGRYFFSIFMGFLGIIGLLILMGMGYTLVFFLLYAIIFVTMLFEWITNIFAFLGPLHPISKNPQEKSKEQLEQKKKKRWWGKSPILFFLDMIRTRPDYRQNIIRYIRSKKGVVQFHEMVRLTGWNNKKVDALLLQLLKKFQGDVEVTEQGTIYYIFKNIGLEEAESLIPDCWQAEILEDQRKVMEDTQSEVGSFSGILLLIFLFFYYFHEICLEIGWEFSSNSLYPSVAVKTFALVILVYVLVVYGVQLPGLIIRRLRNRFQVKRYVKSRLLEVIATKYVISVPKALKLFSNLRYPEKVEEREGYIKKLLEQLTIQLHGKIEPSENGKDVLYHFPNWKREDDDIAFIRSEIKVKEQEIVYET